MIANPMRWKCDALGCYNKLARPKIEVFAECFPGKIAMGDIDGVVEINGRFLIVEWKTKPGPISIGQVRMYEAYNAIPGHRFTVLCIAGSAETMEVTHAMCFRPGRSWHRASLSSCKRFMRRWATWAIEQQRSMAA